MMNCGWLVELLVSTFILTWFMFTWFCMPSCAHAAQTCVKQTIRRGNVGGARTSAHLQQQHQLRVLDVHGDVERRLVELAESVNVGAVLDERLGHAVMAVLRRPVKRRHLQHVFGVDVGAALEVKRRNSSNNSSGGSFYNQYLRLKVFVLEMLIKLLLFLSILS